jgi:predicted alpha/beta-fold hydrolase
MIPYRPLFRNPHLQTVAAHYWKRPDAGPDYPLTRRLFRTEPDVQVAVDSQQPRGQPAGHVVMVHGLEGSSEAAYVRSLSTAVVLNGFAAHRFQMRTCGGTEHLCNTLYHAGLTSDLHSVVRQIQAGQPAPVFLVGFSLGGNVVLKLAGELGDEGPALLRGVCGVSTPLDLKACALRIAKPDNRVYEKRFVKRMRARLGATGRYPAKDIDGLKSVWEIDDRITAPSFGFGNAENYYQTQSAVRFLERIRVPVLLIQAKDDTLVPFEIFTAKELTGNPLIEVRVTESGGHLGFLGRRPHRWWVDDTLVEWIEERAT